MLKEAWLQAARVRMPVGQRVIVVRSDEAGYIGKHGVVTEYDLGVQGEYPMVVVQFDEPVQGVPTIWKGGAIRDGFWCDGVDDDEIVKAP